MNSIYPVKDKKDLSEDKDLDRILSLYEIIKKYEFLVEFLLNHDEGLEPLNGRGLREVTDSVVHKLEKEYIHRVLIENDFNRLKSAKVLDVSYKTLLVKMKEYNITGKGEHIKKEELEYEVV